MVYPSSQQHSWQSALQYYRNKLSDGIAEKLLPLNLSVDFFCASQFQEKKV